ncbi:MAG TPA: BTAD domain-containing putative transcriptional regulator [Acidimicrobiales bacterium]|nr:BTAD domain-containing putative transcriptional regulator [Acidimicrobiales bacterium]
MEFRVLGSIEVRRGGDIVPIGSRNERKLLTALLVDANSVVSTSRLIEIVWAGDPPPSDRNALQTYIARLRRRLGGAATPAPIVSRPPGYLIELRPHQLDSLQFRELLLQGQAVLSVNPARALEILDDALALWRGPAFAEFADEDVARAEAACLEELRQSAVEHRVEALLALGRSAEALSVLERAVVAHPLRERPHAQLMRALAACGRQVDALRLYQRYRERLVDELGIEPSAGLRDLEGDILRQAPHPGPVMPPTPSPPGEGNLVPAVTPLVGREGDVAELVALLGRARVVTLVGVGGVGKSRLALRLAETVASDFPDGTWVAELAPISLPEAVPHAVAAALGVVPSAAGTLSDALVDALRARRLLLVVDNCEHVLDAVSRLVEVLARRCPKLTVVATSRERLAVNGEHVWRVPPLPVPPPGAKGDNLEASPAVALFIDRAHAARADFRLNDANTDAVADICRGLDGLPLALEIAAARLGVLTAQDMAGRLRERFALLTAGPRGEGDRHRTLRALVDWSYGLLDEAERAVFARISVFAGGWTLDAATTVCVGDTVSVSQVGGLVASLADKSMVVPLAAAGPGRYGILETLRLYGAERLEARGETESTRGAHARHFVVLAEAAEAGSRGPDEAEWVRRLRAEIDNLRAAHAWSRESGTADFALRLSAALHRFASWQANDEVLSWAEAAVELPAARGHPLLPVVLGSAAVRRLHRGEMSIAAEYANRALTDCAGHDDPRRALPTEALAGASLLTGRLDEAFELYGEAVRLWRLTGDDEAVVWTLCGRAVSAAKNGHLSTAVGLTEEAWQVAAAAGSPTMKAHVLYSQGESLLEVDPLRALAPIERALELATSVDNVFMQGLALVSATSLRGRHAEPRLALRLFDDVIQHWRRGGNWTQQWLALRNLVELIARVGADEPAAVLYGACTASSTSPSIYGPEVHRLEGVVATVVSRVGQRAFDQARRRGASLSDEEAVSFALAVTRRLLADDEPPVTAAGG